MTNIDITKYLQMKEAKRSANSLIFDCEIKMPDNKRYELISASFKVPKKLTKRWNYSYNPNNYGAYPEPLRRVRTSCVDLSKY
jgi:hypothetical protein